MSKLTDQLLDAVRSPETAAVVMNAALRPVGGDSAVVMPPTYPPVNDPEVPPQLRMYILEQQWVDGEAVKAVVLDQWSSQANRVEEAILDACDAGTLQLPRLELRVETSRTPVRLTSFDVPHRYADAYWRDSLVDGVRFDKSPLGERLRSANEDDVRPLYEREPLSLLLGAWDSHRKGRWPRFPRVYQSRIVGIDPLPSGRRGGRMDPLNLVGNVDDTTKAEGDWKFVAEGAKKEKGKKLSEIGHGNIAPNESHGGVSVRSIHRRASASLNLLRRLRFGDAPADAADAARAALLALAVAGDRLAFGGASIWLRSGCDLLVLDESVAFERRGGATEVVDVDAAGALAAFAELRDRAASGGVPMLDDVVVLEPTKQLKDAIEFAMASATTEE